MKVLFLSNIPSPYRIAFFNELGKLCDLTVVFEGRKATDRNSKWKYEEIVNFKCLFLKGIRTKSDQFFCPEIIKILKETYNHIIIGGYSTPTGMLAIEYLKLKKRKFFIEADGGVIRNDNKLKYSIKRHFISSADAWFSSGRKTTEYLVHYGAVEERVFIYPFTSLKNVDILSAVPQIHEKNKLRNELGMKEKYIVVGVGRFIECKGFDILLKATIKLNKEIGIYIIGDKPTKEYLDIQKKYSLKNVHFINFMSKEKLSSYYRAADIFVLPTRGDVWGLVINEAMANGLPIITTNQCVAGIELVKDGENGYILPVDDIDELTKHIELVFNKDIRKMGEESLKIISYYTLEHMAQRHYEVLEALKEG